MLGAILGNIIGSEHVGNMAKDTQQPTTPTWYTGDTVMTLAVVKWLLDGTQHTPTRLVYWMQKLGRGHFHAGYDEHFKEWLLSTTPKPYDECDFTAALHVSPVGLYAATLEETKTLSRLVAMAANIHPDSVKSAMAVAECVFLNRNRTDNRKSLADVKDAVRQRITNVYGYNVSRTLEEMRTSQKPGSNNMDDDLMVQYHSVQRAINVFLVSDSLEECVHNSLSVGGDPVIITTISCSIFAANKEGWDGELMKKYEHRLPLDLQDIMDNFERLVFPTKPTYHSFKVTDNIYAGEYPRDRDEGRSANKMRQFERFGISHFIDLTEKGELAPYNNYLYGKMSHMRFPIADVSVPESTDKVRDLLWQIDQILRVFPDMKIYIHCWGGVGRTGTIVGCLLAHLMGYDYDQTMATLRQLFKDCPKSSYRRIPETGEQCRFIARYIKDHCGR